MNHLQLTILTKAHYINKSSLSATDFENTKHFINFKI